MSLPEFDGTDLHRLAGEVARARRYLKQATVFREMYKQFNQSNAAATKTNDSGAKSTMNKTSSMMKPMRPSSSRSQSTIVAS